MVGYFPPIRSGVLLPFSFHQPGTSDLGTYPYPFTYPTSDIWWSSLETCSNLFTWGLTSLQSPVLTSTGDHQNMYGWQGGSEHPTHSYLNCDQDSRSQMTTMITTVTMTTETDNSWLNSSNEPKRQKQRKRKWKVNKEKSPLWTWKSMYSCRVTSATRCIVSTSICQR